MGGPLPLALTHLREAEEDLPGRSLLAVVAQAKGQGNLALLALYAEDERREMLGQEPLFD